MESDNVVAIVGSGIIGRSWAVLFARAGFFVRMFDSVASQLPVASSALDTLIAKLDQEQLLNGRSPQEVRNFISLHSQLQEAVQGVSYVQECVPEDVAIKEAVFVQLDSLCDEHVLLVSSTSNLTPEQFTKNLSRHRHRCLVAHPVNPPFAIPVVEMVPASWTDTQCMERAANVQKEIGQRPVMLKRSVDGFLVNRLQYALLMEGMRLVQDGVCDAQDIDCAVREGLGLRWSFLGPFETIDLNAPHGTRDYCQRYLSSIERVVRTQDNQVQISPQTVEKIAQEMETRVPPEKRAQRIEWRNERLLSLHKHKQQAIKWD